MLCYRLAASLKLKSRIFPLANPMQLRYSSHKSAKARKALSSLKQGLQPRKPRASTQTTFKPNITPPIATKIHPPFPNALTLEEQLAGLQEPTLLYRKSYWKIALTSSVIAGLGLGAIYNSYYSYIVVPVDTPAWIRATHYATIVLMGIAVAAVLVYPARLIRSIYCIPYRPGPDSPPTVKLQIWSNRLLSFFIPPLKTEVTLNDVYLGRKMTRPPIPIEDVPGGAFDRFVQALAVGQAKTFRAVREFITREKIVPVHIKSRHLSLGIYEDGWQWEERGLDRLLGSDKKWY